MANTRVSTLPAAFVILVFGFPALTTPALGAAKETVLHDFGSRGDGSDLSAGLTFDQGGNLYGTTPRGGNTPSGCGELGCGVVFRLTPTKQGNWKESTLYSFTGEKDGGSPQAGVILDAQGNVYGTAYEGVGWDSRFRRIRKRVFMHLTASWTGDLGVQFHLFFVLVGHPL
jgi:hypothetical protein